MAIGSGQASPAGVLGRLRRSSASDEQLLRRARLGDDSAFEELYRRHHPAVFGYCLGRLADRHAAEDAAQEVFARAAASAAEVGSVRSWLFTIAHNAVIDAVRRRTPDSALLDLEAVVDSADYAAEESAFAALDTVTGVFIALRRLPARDRKALILREFQDRSSADIAVDLETSAANVDVIVSRARAAFGRAYAEVAELPPACRQATETIYRELGSGASERRLVSMRAHLQTCPRCRAEHRRAHSPRYLGALAPLLQISAHPRLAAIAEALWPHAASAGGLLERIGAAGWSAPVRAALTIAVVGTTLTPVVMDRAVEARTPDADAHVTLARPTAQPQSAPDSAGDRQAVVPAATAVAVLPDAGGNGAVSGTHPAPSSDTAQPDLPTDAGCTTEASKPAAGTAPSMSDTACTTDDGSPAIDSVMMGPVSMDPTCDPRVAMPRLR